MFIVKEFIERKPKQGEAKHKKQQKSIGNKIKLRVDLVRVTDLLHYLLKWAGRSV